MKTLEESNLLITEFMGLINLRTARPELNFSIDLWQIGVFVGESESSNHVRSPLDKSYCVVKELKYDKSWNWLMPAFEKFCTEMESSTKLSRLNVSFCSNFIHGVWNNRIDHSFKSLVDGIEWLNMKDHMMK